MELRQRHVPMRRCVACGDQRPQREMVRIVRTLRGQVAIDQERRKMAGRGAYICRKETCWEAALKKDRVGHALRGQLTEKDKLKLSEFAVTLGQRQ